MNAKVWTPNTSALEDHTLAFIKSWEDISTPTTVRGLHKVPPGNIVHGCATGQWGIHFVMYR